MNAKQRLLCCAFTLKKPVELMTATHYRKRSSFFSISLHLLLLLGLLYSNAIAERLETTTQVKQALTPTSSEQQASADHSVAKESDRDQQINPLIEAYLYQAPPAKKQIKPEEPPQILSKPSDAELSEPLQSLKQSSFKEKRLTADQLLESFAKAKPKPKPKRCKWRYQRNQAPVLSEAQREFYRALHQWKQTLARRIQQRQYYPSDAIQAKAGGRVIIAFQMHPSGKIVKPYVLSSSGRSDLDQSALYALKTLPTLTTARKFVPRTKHMSLHFEFDPQRPVHPSVRWPRPPQAEGSYVQICEE